MEREKAALEDQTRRLSARVEAYRPFVPDAVRADDEAADKIVDAIRAEQPIAPPNLSSFMADDETDADAFSELGSFSASGNTINPHQASLSSPEPLTNMDSPLDTASQPATPMETSFKFPQVTSSLLAPPFLSDQTQHSAVSPVGQVVGGLAFDDDCGLKTSHLFSPGDGPLSSHPAVSLDLSFDHILLNLDETVQGTAGGADESTLLSTPSSAILPFTSTDDADSTLPFSFSFAENPPADFDLFSPTFGSFCGATSTTIFTTPSGSAWDKMKTEVSVAQPDQTQPSAQPHFDIQHSPRTSAPLSPPLETAPLEMAG